MAARTIRIAVIGGDGIGPEVVAEAIKVLRAAATDVTIDTTSYDLGAQRWHRTGEILPDTVLSELAGHDAILLGAVGDPTVPERRSRARPAAAAAVRVRPVRQPAAGPALSRRGIPAVRPAGRADRHAGRAGGHRGSVHRGRRHHAERHPRRGGHPGKHQHRLRRRAGDQVRAAAGRGAAQEADPRAQDERAGLRRRPVAADRGQPGRRVSRGGRRVLPHGRGIDVLRDSPPSSST